MTVHAPENENDKHVNNGDIARDDVPTDADKYAGEAVENTDHDLTEDEQNGDSVPS